MAQAAEARKRGKTREPSADKDALLKAYHDMLLIRRFEEKAGQLYGMGLIGGFCHLYIGQEAVVVGMQMALSKGDEVITSYRDHGHMLATGMDPRGVMAELTGRAGGYSHGKGGSMHMFSKAKNFFGGHGIVGAQVSIGTGLGFSNWYRGNDRVCVTYFGEGASNQGADEAARGLCDREQQIRHGHQRRACIGIARPVEERRAMGHSRHAGRWHGRAGGEGGRRTGGGVLPIRQGAISARGEDLPLSRSLDVGPGALSHARGGADDAHAA
jgi:hypothetical protein